MTRVEGDAMSYLPTKFHQDHRGRLAGHAGELLRRALAADEVLKVGVIHQGAIADTGWEYFQAQAWRSLREDLSRQGEGDGAGEHHAESRMPSGCSGSSPRRATS